METVTYEVKVLRTVFGGGVIVVYGVNVVILVALLVLVTLVVVVPTGLTDVAPILVLHVSEVTTESEAHKCTRETKTASSRRILEQRY